MKNTIERIDSMALTEVFIRVILTVILMIFMARINGPKQIAQMSFYDYVSGITVGSIAATISVNKSVSFLAGLFAIFLFLGISLLLNFITQKNLKANMLLTGEPINLIVNGTINTKGLSKSKMTMSELLSNLRYNGYFNIRDVESAILEPTGKLSVQPKGYARKVRYDDIHTEAKIPEKVIPVIMSGCVLTDNLSSMDKDKRWLLRELKKQGMQLEELKDILLAVLDGNEKLTVYKK